MPAFDDKARQLQQRGDDCTSTCCYSDSVKAKMPNSGASKPSLVRGGAWGASRGQVSNWRMP
jgi:hypothetical protein